MFYVEKLSGSARSVLIPFSLSRSTVITRTRGATGRISSQSIVRGTEAGPKIVRRDSESQSKLFHCAALRPTVPGEHHRNRRLTDSDRCRQFNLANPPRLHVAVEAVRKGLLLKVHPFGDVLLLVHQRGHVTHVVGLVRQCREDPAHDLAGAGLGYVGHEVDVIRPRDLADGFLDGVLHGFFDRLARLKARREGDVDVGHLAPQVVFAWDDRSLGHLGYLEAAGFDLLGAQTVASDVNHVVHATEDAVVAVRRLHGRVTGQVRPVLPVLAVPVLAVLAVVRPDVAIAVAPEGLQTPRPRVADADVTGLVGAGREFLAMLVVDHRVDARHAWPGAARLHRVDGWHRAAEETSVLGLPPGIDDDGLLLADVVVVPLPHLGLDGLAHRGHVLEAIVVLGGLVGPELPQPANGRGRGVEDVDVEPLGDAPGPPRVGVSRHALVNNTGRRQSQRPVDDVGVARDPTNVRHAPVHVLWMYVLDILGGPGHVSEVPAYAVLGGLGLARRAAGVHEEEDPLRRHDHRVHALATEFTQQIVDEEVAPVHHGRPRRVLPRQPPPDEHLVHLLPGLLRDIDRHVGIRLVVVESAVAVVGVHRDDDVALGVGDPVAAGVARKAAEHDRVDDPQSGASEHGDRQLRDHRHVDGDPVPRLEAREVTQQRGKLVDADEQILVGYSEGWLLLGLGHEDQGGLVAVLGEVPIDAVVAGVDLASDEPLPARGVARVQGRVPVLVPFEQVGVLFEAVREVVQAEALVNLLVRHVRLGNEIPRWVEEPLLLPVHGYFRLRNLGALSLLRHSVAPLSLFSPG